MWGGESNLDLYVGEILLDRDLEKHDIKKDEVQLVLTVLDKRYRITPEEEIEKNGRTFKIKFNQTVNVDTAGRKTVTVLMGFLVRSKGASSLTKLCHTSCEADVRDDQVKKLIFLVDNSSGVRCGSMTIITYKGRQPSNAEKKADAQAKLAGADKEYNFLRSRRLHWPKSRSSTFDVVVESNLDQDPAVASVELLNLQGRPDRKFRALTRAPQQRVRTIARTWTTAPRTRHTVSLDPTAHVAYDKMKREMQLYRKELRDYQAAHPEEEPDAVAEAKLSKMKYDLELLHHDILEAEKTDAKLVEAERRRLARLGSRARRAAVKVVKKQSAVNNRRKAVHRQKSIQEVQLRQRLKEKQAAFEALQSAAMEERMQRIEAASDAARAHARRKKLKASPPRKRGLTKSYAVPTMSVLIAQGRGTEMLEMKEERASKLENEVNEKADADADTDADYGYKKVSRTLTDLPGPRWNGPIGRTSLWPTETGHQPKGPLPKEARGKPKPTPAAAPEATTKKLKQAPSPAVFNFVKSNKPPTKPLKKVEKSRFAQPTRNDKGGRVGHTPSGSAAPPAPPAERVPAPLVRPAHKPYVPHVPRQKPKLNPCIPKPPVHSHVGDKWGKKKPKKTKADAPPPPPSRRDFSQEIARLGKSVSSMSKKEAKAEQAVLVPPRVPPVSARSKSTKTTPSSRRTPTAGTRSASTGGTSRLSVKKATKPPSSTSKATNTRVSSSALTTASSSSSPPAKVDTDVVALESVLAAPAALNRAGFTRSSQNKTTTASSGKITMSIPVVQPAEQPLDLESDSETGDASGSGGAVRALDEQVKSLESQLQSIKSDTADNASARADREEAKLLTKLDQRIEELTAKVINTSKSLGNVPDGEDDSDDEFAWTGQPQPTASSAGASFMSPPMDPAATRGNWERDMEAKFDHEYRDDDDFSRQLREAFPGGAKGMSPARKSVASRASLSPGEFEIVVDDEDKESAQRRSSFDMDFDDNAPVAGGNDLIGEFDI